MPFRSTAAMLFAPHASLLGLLTYRFCSACVCLLCMCVLNVLFVITPKCTAASVHTKIHRQHQCVFADAHEHPSVDL